MSERGIVTSVFPLFLGLALLMVGNGLLGSLVGPIAVSVLMEALGPAGYFWGLAGFFLPLVVYALVRIIFTVRPKQRRFISLPYRSSTAAALLAEPSEEE